MNWKEKLIEQIKKHEGLRLKPYLCTAGVPTIGFGNTTYENGRLVSLNDASITVDYAVKLLNIYLDKNIYPVIVKIFPPFKSFSDNRKVAVCDMLYNLGEKRLRGFKNTIACINANKWNEAADNAMQSAWYKQVGCRAKTVVNQLKAG